MRKSIASLLLAISFFVYSQETRSNVIDVKSDSIVYHKNTNKSKERTLSSSLKEKYTGKDFEYKEDTPVKEEKIAPIDTGFLEFLGFFMSNIFRSSNTLDFEFYVSKSKSKSKSIFSTFKCFSSKYSLK